MNDIPTTRMHLRYVPIQIEGLPVCEPPLLGTPFDYFAVIAELMEGAPDEQQYATA